MITEQEALSIAVHYAKRRGVLVEKAVFSAFFLAADSPFNVLDETEDFWHIMLDFPFLQGICLDYGGFKINAQTGEVVEICK